MGRRRSFVREEHGSAAVEFSVTASVFFMTVLGLMKMFLAIYAYHFISEAAREGARYAMVRGATCAGFSSACPASSSDVQTYVKSLALAPLSPSSITATTTWSAYPTTGTCSPSTSCNNPGNLVKVNVQYQFPLTIPFMTSHTYTLNSSSRIVIAQ